MVHQLIIMLTTRIVLFSLDQNVLMDLNPASELKPMRSKAFLPALWPFWTWLIKVGCSHIQSHHNQLQAFAWKWEQLQAKSLIMFSPRKKENGLFGRFLFALMANVCFLKKSSLAKLFKLVAANLRVKFTQCKYKFTNLPYNYAWYPGSILFPSSIS